MKRLLALLIMIAAVAVASFATVSFSPSSLSFGSQAVGTTSAVQLVTFSNIGSSSQSFGTEAIAGAYTWGGVGTCGPTLAAGSNCTMSLVFKPTASGTSTGSMTVGSMVVSLTGTSGSTTAASAASAASPVTFSPSSLSFGSQAVGSTSAVKLVTFSNSGSTSQSFGTETIAGAYAWGGVGTCGPTIAAGANCTMSLVFKPTASGTNTGSMTVGSRVVSLTGTGGSTTTPTPTPVAISTASLAKGTTGSAYSATLQATGGTSPYSWSLASGSLPAGLALSTGGAISGTPSTSGISSFSVKAQDSESTPQSATASLTITVAAAGSTPAPTALKITSSTLAGGTAGSSYSTTLQATGGTSPYTWSLASGSLPAGLALSTSGAISGTPSASGTSSFSVTVKDSESTPKSVTGALTLAVAATTTTPAANTPSAGYSAYIETNYTSNSHYTSSNTYYVSATGSDSNSGSQSSPWASLSHADSAAPTCSLVLFGPGTYTLSGTGGEGISTSSSGSSTCHKAYVSTTYGGALLRPAGSGNGYAAWVENGSYTDHVGFDVNNPNGCEGFYGGGPAGGTYIYNIVHDVANGGSPASGGWCANGAGGGGIEPGTNHGTIADNVIYNIGYSGNHWTHGIYMGGGNMQIFNNLIYNASGGCIQDYNNSENDVIVNNTLASCGTFGIVLGAATCSSGNNGNDYVANNIIDADASDGNLVVSCGGTATPSTYTNNLNFGGGAVDVSASNTITTNPDFVNLASPASGGNFELGAGSPAIGAGTSTNAPKVDINGTTRGANSPSIGAYE